MDHLAESGRREPISEERKLALQAKGLFIDASIKNPTSGIGQASRIAFKCKSLKVSPELLGENLQAQKD